MQLLISTICLTLTSVVIGNAYLQKKQFYPAVVYITKSNASMAVIYVQFFVIVFMFGKLLRKIFLGTLRAAEFEHLLERFWYALTETCLAFTVFRDDFNPRFVALFTVLLFLKSFHWLAEERVDFMERSPVLGWLFHIRVASLLGLLGLLDYVLLMHAYESTLVRGPTVQLVFGFEYAILLTVIASTAIKYVLHAAEMRTDTPWENKAVFLLYTELVIGLIKVILYVLFVVIMTKVYALPMFVFRPMFFTIRNFKKALSDVIMSRRAIRNMNTLYPDATPEELRLSDNICIICREDMINHSKKLPCGHIFHTTCLRSWFQRQQTCPTCRLNILRAPRQNSTGMPRADEAAAGVGGAVPPAGAAAVAGGAGVATGVAQPGPIPPAAPITTEPLRTDNPAAPGTSNSIPSSIPPFPNAPNFQGIPMVPPPFMMPPPFQFIAPYAVPPPPMPPDLTSFSDEELRLLEGNERKNIEERIKLLKNIRLMLDSVDILMNNYQLISSRIPPATASTATAQSHSSPTPSTSTATASTQGSINSDGPSTSAAARKQSASDIGASAKPLLDNQPGNSDAGVTIPASKTQPPLGKHNEVTIEDIGGEEHDYIAKNNEKPTSTSTVILPSNASSNDSSELNELRKRRLKYLEELNASTTTHTDTASE